MNPSIGSFLNNAIFQEQKGMEGIREGEGDGREGK